MTEKEIFAFLDEKADAFNHPEYINSDPLQIPHRYSVKQDIEISGFFAATLAWETEKVLLRMLLRLWTSWEILPMIL